MKILPPSVNRRSKSVKVPYRQSPMFSPIVMSRPPTELFYAVERVVRVSVRGL